jgi:NAD(P)-dependent dehydrogenase (short-subunit alcohol dehydrogenase family)
MSTLAAELLLPDLLRETSILVVTPGQAGGGPAESFGHAVREACEQLGSRVHMHAREIVAEDDAAMDRAVGAIAPLAASGNVDAPPGAIDAQDDAAASGGIDMLVVDGAAMFAADGLHACLEGAWDATRAVVNGALLPAARGGRIVYLAPSPSAGEQADAARAGLENLARTLSVEWARHEITVVTIALGDGAVPGEVAALTAYLASPAGAYFSGCLLDLRGV